MSNVSDLILKRGPFASVWIAGTSSDKLGKKMVLATDIEEIVKEILENQRINLVLRVSGMLLKGLVVVYSKKLQYMLTDCEDMITKIKLSFSPSSIDKDNKGQREDLITVRTDISDLTIEPTVDISEWAKAVNPEEYFVIEHPQISFQSAESSQVTTDFDSQPNSSQSTESSQALPHRLHFINSDLGSSTITTPKIGRPQVPEYNEPQANWDDDDDVPIPDIDDSEQPVVNFNRPDSTSETDADAAAEEQEPGKKNKLIVDKRIQLNRNRQTTHSRRADPADRRNMVSGNSQFDSLFADSRRVAQEARQETAENNMTAAPPMSSDSDGPAMAWAPDTDDAGEQERDFQNEASHSDVPGININESDSDDIEPSDLTPYRKKPILTEITSPYPQYKFVVEQTPRRRIEDSITNHTIGTLKKFQDAFTAEQQEKGKTLESINFSKTCAGCNRRRAAQAFYQLLVLKSAGILNVKQGEPFGEIEIIPTSRFWDNE